LAALTSWAVAADEWIAAAALSAIGVLLVVRTVRECGMAIGVSLAALADGAPADAEPAQAVSAEGQSTGVAAPVTEEAGAASIVGSPVGPDLQHPAPSAALPAEAEPSTHPLAASPRNSRPERVGSGA